LRSRGKKVENPPLKITFVLNHDTPPSTPLHPTQKESTRREVKVNTSRR